MGRVEVKGCVTGEDPAGVAFGFPMGPKTGGGKPFEGEFMTRSGPTGPCKP